MTQTIGNAVATKKEAQLDTPRGVVMSMSDEFKNMLPSHLSGEAWLRNAAGALKKGKMVGNGRYELEVAAQNNPAAFVQALREAARLGLTPGSEEYYLTPRLVNGRLEILGITGYQGYVELMFRAGYVESVVVECVYKNDSFDYMPGRDLRPLHGIDWDSEDRGELRLAYAYANMKGGSVSKVVVLNRSDIARIQKLGKVKLNDYSPWVTSPDAMWMKSAARQLRKWVPTSATIIRPFDAVQAASQVPVPATTPPAAGQQPIPDRAQLQIHDSDEVVEAEIVPEQPGENTENKNQPDVTPEAKPPSATREQQAQIGKLFKEKGFNSAPERWQFVAKVFGVGIKHSDMSAAQADQLIEAISKVSTEEPPAGKEPPADPEQVAVDALAAEAK